MRRATAAPRAASCLALFLSLAARAQTIQGLVAGDPSGAPLPSASVRLLRPDTPDALAETETDHDGRFAFRNLPPGRYIVEISKPGHLSATASLTLAPDRPLPPLALRLARCGVVTGTVSDFDGRPIPGVRVFAMSPPAAGRPSEPLSPGLPGPATRTGSSGQYRLYDLPPGPVAIAAAPASGIFFYPANAHPQIFDISAGAEFSGVDFSISSPGGYRVRGTVNAPSPAASFRLSLVSAAMPSLAVAAAQSGSRGEFEFDGVPSGSYDLLAAGPAAGQGRSGALLAPNPLFGRVPVTVLNQDLDGVSVPVGPGVPATLALRIPGPGASHSACPSAASALLTPVEDWGAGISRTVILSLRQSTLVPRLPPGNFKVTLTALGGACFQAAAVSIDLSRGPAEATVPIAPAGSIQGSIDPATAPGIAVALLNPAPSPAFSALRLALPDPGGRFEFPLLPPGQYALALRCLCPASAASAPEQALPVMVRGGTPTVVHLPAQPPCPCPP